MNLSQATSIILVPEQSPANLTGPLVLQADLWAEELLWTGLCVARARPDEPPAFSALVMGVGKNKRICRYIAAFEAGGSTKLLEGFITGHLFGPCISDGKVWQYIELLVSQSTSGPAIPVTFEEAMKESGVRHTLIKLVDYHY